MKLKSLFIFVFSVFICTISFGQSEESSDQEYYDYFQVSEKPEFKSGTFNNYIALHIKYPAQAVINKITGTVYVKFVINKKGKVVDVEIARPVDPLLDKEAMRVVKSSPKWKPGKNNGEIVNVRHTIPVKFQIM